MYDIGQLKRLRWVVRLVLALGVAASVAANILHANPNPISQTISAWPPLALLLTIELVSRIPVNRWYLATIRVAATVAIAGIAGWVSYWHMVAVAARYGETGNSAYLLPFTVDGLIVVASVSLVELAGRIRTLEVPLPAAVPVVAKEEEVELLGGPVSVPVTEVVEPVVGPPATERRVKGGPRGGKSGPQDSGPSLAGLNGKALMLDTPKV